MLPELSEALRLPLPGITPPALKLTADAGRFEWGGRQFWPKYLSQVRDRLLPGGIQAIINQDRLLATYRREVDFIQRYVFPGRHAALAAGAESLGERCSIPVIRERIFGQDYAKTLAGWAK